MKITINIAPELYDDMIKELGRKTLGDALKDPLIMVCAHVREAKESNSGIEVRDDQEG